MAHEAHEGLFHEPSETVAMPAELAQALDRPLPPRVIQATAQLLFATPAVAQIKYLGNDAAIEKLAQDDYRQWKLTNETNLQWEELRTKRVKQFRSEDMTNPAAACNAIRTWDIAASKIKNPALSEAQKSRNWHKPATRQVRKAA